MATTRYSVVDVETTGLRAGSRLTEIALLSLDEHGRLLDIYESLLDPGRPPGPTSVHGITAEDCLDAPQFADVAAEVHRRLLGTVLIGHNLRFDWRLFRAEFERCGAVFLREPAGVCTALACRRMGLPARLRDACEALGIPVATAHRARADATATLRLWSALRCLGAPLPEGSPMAAAHGWHRLRCPAAPRPRQTTRGTDVEPESTPEEVL